MNGKNVLVNYLNWVKDFNPVLYAALKVTRPDIFNALNADGLAYLGADEVTATTGTETWWKKLTNTAAEALKSFLPIYQQKKILDVQLDLMKSGKAPLTNDQIMAAGTTNIQVSLPPEIQAEVMKTAQTAQSGMNWGTVALIGVAGFALFQMMKPKGRRR